MTNDLPRDNHDHSILQFTMNQDQLADRDLKTLYVDQDLDDSYIRDLNSAIPVPVLYPQRLFDKTQQFIAAFTGEVLYAVKCNPDKLLLKTMYAGGVRKFDAASIAEVRLIHGLFPDAKIYFMHPIKAPEAIREAYVNHNVRAFVLDYAGELDKILEETNAAPDLELFVRMAIPKNKADNGVATDFASKFGAQPADAVNLLRACRPYCKKLGLSFHVGTQCNDPAIYTNALAHAAEAINQSDVDVEVLDIGGGFPADLKSATAIPPISTFTQRIAEAVRVNNLDHLELLCEVGRGLVACAGALIVRIEGRKDDLLYLNDGTYGGMFEAGGAIGLPYPAKLIRREQSDNDAPLQAFRFAGPTCDSVDMMNGPFMLPEDVQIGDWIKLDQLGAYGEVSRTDFNGFGSVQKIIVQEDIAIKQNNQIAI